MELEVKIRKKLGGFRMDMEFQAKAGTRKLSFASAEDLMKYLGLVPGAVTPFGVLNDVTKSVQVFIDSDYAHGKICVHPNSNDASVTLETDDLVALISDHGNMVSYFSF